MRAEQTSAQTQQAGSDEREREQARFQTAFENLPFGQKIITPDLIIWQANQVVVQMLGCEQLADVVGHQIMEFAHPDHRADWQF